MQFITHVPPKHEPWNKGKTTGQKPPQKLKEIWAIPIRLQMNNRIRDLAIDSKLRACTQWHEALSDGPEQSLRYRSCSLYHLWAPRSLWPQRPGQG